MIPLDVNPLEDGLIIGEWSSNDWVRAEYVFELWPPKWPGLGEAVVCLTRTFGRHKKSKSVKFPWTEIDALIDGLKAALDSRGAFPPPNTVPVGPLTVPGYGLIELQWGAWDWERDVALLIRQQRRHGGSSAVAVWDGHFDEVIPWFIETLRLAQRLVPELRSMGFLEK